MEDAIESSLDILDSHYKRMNEILKKPIFFDSVEIRQAVNSIKECHSAVLLIAQKLTKNIGYIDEAKEENPD